MKKIPKNNKQVHKKTKKKTAFPLAKRIQREIGNILMITGLAVLVFIYYPYALLFLSPQKITPIEHISSNEFVITIPGINAQSKIVENVDPWKENEYKKELEKGVAHAKGSSLPGENGTVYLFAHSSDVPWRITKYNTPFLRLGRLVQGDEIVITRNGNVFKYRVRETKTVRPDQIQYLKNLEKNQLILQTCTPVGTAINRLLVFAEEVI